MSSKTKRSGNNDDKSKSKLIYFSYEASRKKEGDGDTDIIEKKVKHSGDEFFCKYYEKINSKITKISVKSPTDGGEYTVIIQKDNGDKKETVYDKKELIKFLKSRENLDFVLNYVNNKNTQLTGGAKKKKKAAKKKSSTGTKKSSWGGAKKKKAGAPA